MEWIAADDKMIKIYKAEKADDWTGLHWHGNKMTVPSDSPLCGWKGEFCDVENPRDKVPLIVTTVTVVLTIIIVFLIGFIIKKYRYESMLKGINMMIVKWDDLVTVSRKGQMTSGSNLSRLSEISTMGYRNKADIVYLFDTYATIFPIGNVSIDLNDKSVIADLKQMTGLSHENLNKFLALCPHAPHVCYIMAYAERGTLQDILSGSYRLSNDFKISFILDIACGMWYLHQSPVRYHGSLCSSECLIDNRWTCKITGYGLHYTRSQYGEEPELSADRLLWSAPEMLNDDTVPLDKAKADVYSFAIIMTN